ncbi:hypothetical protein ECTW09195_5859, partial [Escherichia coli TW09195]
MAVMPLAAKVLK